MKSNPLPDDHGRRPLRHLPRGVRLRSGADLHRRRLHLHVPPPDLRKTEEIESSILYISSFSILEEVPACLPVNPLVHDQDAIVCSVSPRSGYLSRCKALLSGYGL